MRVLDLFSGIGGFSLGLEKTGFKTVGFCEADADCRKVLEKNWPGVEVISDIKNFNGFPLRGMIEVICGGFPCQDISIGGRQSGIKGERSRLWKEYKRLINEIGPKYAIIENVERLRKNGLGIVLRDLAEIGYDAEWHCVTARAIGFAHQRDRIWIISYPSGQRRYEYSREKRHISLNENRTHPSLYAKRKECQPESLQVRQILSRGYLKYGNFANAKNRATVPGVRRVTNGVPQGLDEARRKIRIKQLGNSIVPQMAELIGYAIQDEERRKCTSN